MKRITLLAAAALALAGCATAIPTASKMSDIVMMTVKPSPVQSVAFNYVTEVQDGEISPCDKESRSILTGHPGYIHSESQTLGKMLRDYLTLKFSTINPASKYSVSVRLKDFWLEEYSNDSTGNQIMTGIFGAGSTNRVTTANADIFVEVNDGINSIKKLLKVSAEASHNFAIGYGSMGQKRMPELVAEAINSLNSKAIIMINRFIDDTSQQAVAAQPSK